MGHAAPQVLLLLLPAAGFVAFQMSATKTRGSVRRPPSGSGKPRKPGLLGSSEAHRQDALDEEPAEAALRKRFNEYDERRQREWKNYKLAQRSTDEQVAAPSVVFIDLSVGDAAPSRIVIELFDDTPITAENFRSLLLGERGFDAATGTKLDYIDSACHRLVRGVGIFLGELSGGVSVASTGGVFKDEIFAHRHTGRGVLSMANRGPDTNGSAFFISFDKTPQLDFQQVVFGRIIEGVGVLDTIESLPTSRNGVPKVPIVMTFCGALNGKQPIRSMAAADAAAEETAAAEEAAAAAAALSGKNTPEPPADGAKSPAEDSERSPEQPMGDDEAPATAQQDERADAKEPVGAEELRE